MGVELNFNLSFSDHFPQGGSEDTDPVDPTPGDNSLIGTIVIIAAVVVVAAAAVVVVTTIIIKKKRTV